MAYDLHVVRTKNWLEASSAPITRQDVDTLIAGDPELAWSTTDYVDMSDHAGTVTRCYMITWRGQPCFWWYRDHIRCSGPDEAQQSKLVQMASAERIRRRRRRRDLRRGRWRARPADPKAEHGLGVIRTRRSDRTEHAHAMIAHGLELAAKR